MQPSSSRCNPHLHCHEISSIDHRATYTIMLILIRSRPIEQRSYLMQSMKKLCGKDLLVTLFHPPLLLSFRHFGFAFFRGWPPW